MKPLFLILLPALAFLTSSCTPGIDMPKGTSSGYQSARLIQRAPDAPAITDPVEIQVNGMIQKSIGRQFQSHGMSYGGRGADLAVGYMVLYQEPGMTARYDDYFGYGRNTDEISDLAHSRVLGNRRPDFFRQAGIVVDVIDARTNKLVFRNFVKGDVVKEASSGTRAARIDAAVAEALQPFFRGR